MLLPIEDGKEDVTDAGKRYSSASFPALGITQVDQMQTTAAAGD